MDEDELEAEIRAGSNDPDEALAVAPAKVPPKKGGIPAWAKLGVVFVLLSGAVTALLFGTGNIFVYSKKVDEVMSEPDSFRDRELRVEGQMRLGSVVFEAEPQCEHRFVLEREGHEMPVRFPRCVVPDTFRDDMPMDVVVQGRLQADNSFLANEVIPRCPSKYQEREQNGEANPHVGPGETS